MFVFISHSHADKAAAHQLAEWLTMNSVPYFIDDKDIRVGAHISKQVREALSKTTHFVILLSPAAIGSKWVNYELGVAEGMTIASPEMIRVLPYVVYPVSDLPSYLSDRKSVNTLAQLTEELKVALANERVFVTASSVSSRMYQAAEGEIPALRLVGAYDEYFPASAIRVVCRDTPYLLPHKMRESEDAIITTLTATAKSRNAPFFDGPHTRLMDFNFTNAKGADEQKILELTLGPIGWYHFSVAEWHTNMASTPELAQWVDIERIRQTGSVVHTSLPNILDTATTLVTSDGVLIFSQRGSQVSAGSGLLTSAVAENIHVEKDHSLSEAFNSDLPSPFRAALRGIEEELSPMVLEAFLSDSRQLLCLGLSYSLVDYHPNILFLGVVPLSFAELLDMCKRHPGRDFFEGKLLGCSLTHSATELNSALRRSDWTGGGKASFFRAIEFIRAFSSKRGVSIQAALDEIGHLKQ